MRADRQLEATIYRWEDGWTVVCSVDLDDDYDLPVRMKFRDPSGDVGVEFFWAKGLSPDVLDAGAVFFDDQVGQKFFGFLLDAGVSDRSYLSSDLGLRTRTLGSLRFPSYVPDDLWARRYEQARQIFLSEEDKAFDFLLWEAEAYRMEEDVSDEDGRGEGTVYLKVTDEASFDLEWGGETIEEAIDNFADGALVLPESQRESWESENALRGIWVLPTPEEVEVYRTLGEELPFQWEASRLAAWLRERSP